MFLRKIGCKIYLVSGVIKIPRSSRGPDLPIGMVTLVVVGYKTTPRGINQTSKVKVGTSIWEFEKGDFVKSSPAIGPDGTVYVGSHDEKLYAIKTDSKGLAKSPWPMRGQNPLHTGRVMKK